MRVGSGNEKWRNAQRRTNQKVRLELAQDTHASNNVQISVRSPRGERNENIFQFSDAK